MQKTFLLPLDTTEERNKRQELDELLKDGWEIVLMTNYSEPIATTEIQKTKKGKYGIFIVLQKN